MDRHARLLWAASLVLLSLTLTVSAGQAQQTQEDRIVAEDQRRTAWVDSWFGGQEYVNPQIAGQLVSRYIGGRRPKHGGPIQLMSGETAMNGIQAYFMTGKRSLIKRCDDPRAKHQPGSPGAAVAALLHGSYSIYELSGRDSSTNQLLERRLFDNFERMDVAMYDNGYKIVNEMFWGPAWTSGYGAVDSFLGLREKKLRQWKTEEFCTVGSEGRMRSTLGRDWRFTKDNNWFTSDTYNFHGAKFDLSLRPATFGMPTGLLWLKRGHENIASRQANRYYEGSSDKDVMPLVTRWDAEVRGGLVAITVLLYHDPEVMAKDSTGSKGKATTAYVPIISGHVLKQTYNDNYFPTGPNDARFAGTEPGGEAFHARIFGFSTRLYVPSDTIYRRGRKVVTNGDVMSLALGGQGVLWNPKTRGHITKMHTREVQRRMQQACKAQNGGRHCIDDNQFVKDSTTLVPTVPCVQNVDAARPGSTVSESPGTSAGIQKAGGGQPRRTSRVVDVAQGSSPQSAGPSQRGPARTSVDPSEVINYGAQSSGTQGDPGLMATTFPCAKPSTDSQNNTRDGVRTLRNQQVIQGQTREDYIRRMRQGAQQTPPKTPGAKKPGGN